MRRFAAACKAFWTILTSAETYRRWQQALPEAETEEKTEEPSRTKQSAQETRAGDAVYTLVLLQRAGRLVDFLKEDIEGFSDAQVGAAVRQIHANCRKILDEAFAIEPIQPETEGASITVPQGFDPRSIRVTGQPEGGPPYHGTVTHRGWRATDVDLPERHQDLDPTVVCPAEIDVEKA